MNQVEVYNLKKVFLKKKGFLKKKKEEFTAVNDVNFTIKKGQIFSLLGPNGAGKTTTVKMLSTLLIPTSGEAYVCGKHILKNESEVRKLIGTVLPGERTLYWKLTVKENLKYFGSLYGLSSRYMNVKINELMKYFEIEDKKNELVEKLSTGLRQRVVLSRALMADPEVILLDEPTLGLDPVAARLLRKMIVQLKNDGKTILLTTHYMQEADDLSDIVSIIDNGKIIAMDTPRKLKGQLNTEKIAELKIEGKNPQFDEALKNLYPEVRIEENQDENSVTYKVMVNETVSLYNQFGSLTEKFGISLIKLQMSEPSLEDVFIHLTGKQMKEGSNEVVH